MKKRLILLLVALVAVMLVVVACAADDPAPPAADPAPPAQEAAAGGEVTEDPVAPEATVQTHLEVLVPSIAVSMDPVGSNDSASAEFSRLVYQTLFRLDYNTFEPLFELATSYEFEGPQTLHLSIREGVTFHNGDPLTAHDVAFSLTRAGASVEMEIIFGIIDYAEAHNDTDLTLHLNIPFAPILRHLAHPGGGVVPMNHFNDVGEEAFRASPVGSGQFMFVDFVVGSHYDLARFDDYSGVMPVLETIRFRVVPEPSVRLIEVSDGTADVALGIAPADIVVAEADPNVNFMRRLSMGIDLIWFNTLEEHPMRRNDDGTYEVNPLANPLVRQAINYAFDTEAVVANVFLGAGAINHTALPPGAFGFVEQPPFDTNLDRARELLEEAGFADGFETNIWWNAGNPQRETIAQMMQFALAPLGIDVTIETLEWGDYLQRSGEGREHDMLILGWITVTGDGDYGLFPLFHSDNFGMPGNRGFLYSPELDALLLAGREELSEAGRLAIYAEALAYLRQNAPIVMLRSGEALVAVNPNLRNVVLNPTLSHNWGTAYFVD